MCFNFKPGTVKGVDLVTVTVKKLVMREKHKLDSRSYALSLTKKGSEIVKQALPIVESIDKEYFGKNKQKIKLLYTLTR